MLKKLISLFIITAIVSALLISCMDECETTAKTLTTPSTVPEQTTTVTTQTTTNCITGGTTKDSVSTTQNTFVTTLSATEVISRPMEKNVTISAGGNTVTPKLVFSHGIEYGNGTTAIADGYLILGGYFGYNAFKEDQKEFPTLTCSSVDEIKVTVNGEELREENFAFYDADDLPRRKGAERGADGELCGHRDGAADRRAHPQASLGGVPAALRRAHGRPPQAAGGEAGRPAGSGRRQLCERPVRADLGGGIPPAFGAAPGCVHRVRVLFGHPHLCVP